MYRILPAVLWLGSISRTLTMRIVDSRAGPLGVASGVTTFRECPPVSHAEAEEDQLLDRFARFATQIDEAMHQICQSPGGQSR